MPLPTLKSLLRQEQASNLHLYARIADGIDANAWRRPLLSTNARAMFLYQCWNCQLSHNLEAEIKPFESYLLHYEESCLQLPAALQELSHRDIWNAVRYLTGSLEQSYDTVVRTLPLPTQSAATRAKCLEFIGRAVLLLDLVKWRGNESLSNFLKQELAVESTQNDQFRLPTSFNARTFERMAGIKIVWTHNLSSHLKVGSDMELLNIFHHAKVLDLYEASPLNQIFPPHFIEETRQTLALMVPKGNRASKVWFGGHQKRLMLDAAAGSCPYLGEEMRNIQRFNFWRDRLIIAKEVFDEGQPGNILQVWRDDRNKVQWWTFWIAFVVFWLTVANVVEGALQVYKAYYPTRSD